MALSFSHHPLLHGNKTPFTLQSQCITSSNPNNASIFRYPSIRCCSSLNQKSSINLRTCKNCKTQFDPSLNHPLACRFHTAHFGDMKNIEVKILDTLEPFSNEKEQDVVKELDNVSPPRIGETKRKFESVYEGGTMNTPDSGKVFQYWHCCGSEDPFDPGCTSSPHTSYDD